MAGMIYPVIGCGCTGLARVCSQFWLLKRLVARNLFSLSHSTRENLPSDGKNEKWHIPVIRIVQSGVKSDNRIRQKRMFVRQIEVVVENLES
ncbi:hypothetical protein WNZ14_13000 [Hoeflea sp. AS60]|uniref:hypothetical protein n=1 Tax=Hoeflea sp. AS60 TaxID=3135780 RepID=UPI00317D0F34